ncbi:ankyrin repeat domain-containing protein 40-like isoform X1 [Schistocerca cancellata]|uniref:ankyrin repeat domain-containing protein 40-like isoform X1 n=1 Tax=Schistocerca cancellata TaxID=274614 RepID=UPI0021184392|nr:ankyrin repeat domain-containing protein 40-like isoform X1 [Schistocerca cancellata]
MNASHTAENHNTELVKNVQHDSLREESLREASCIGDIETVELLLSNGTLDVNARHKINGWTALHWAAKRGHKDIVLLLLANGADKNILTNKSELPAALCSSAEIRKLLETPSNTDVQDSTQQLPIVPNYLKNPTLITMNSRKPPAADSGLSNSSVPVHAAVAKSAQHSGAICDELVLKARVANSGELDFIEIELPHSELTYNKLLRVCCDELGVNATQVLRLRKLPDTVLRKDKDIRRLKDFQEIEVVVAPPPGRKLVPGSNGFINVPAALGTNINGYQSISLHKNQTILY